MPIIVPRRINVGFQKRSGTYTGQLAYVIYYDEKGKLRKEPSWNSWRDKSIPNQEFDNEPTEGFVLNKKVGGYDTGWNHRNTYTRVYDPRGFEFEITVENLLWLLENCNCIKGKGLEGEFIYGWDGVDLVLVPCESPDYKKIADVSKIVNDNEFIKAKDLVVGYTYKFLDGREMVYMGKFKSWRNITRNQSFDGCVRRKISGYGYCYKYAENKQSDKNEFFFVEICGNKLSCSHIKNVTRKITSVASDSMENYPACVDALNKYECYSPIDYSKDEIRDLPFDAFERKLSEMVRNNSTCDYLTFGRLSNDRLFGSRVTYTGNGEFSMRFYGGDNSRYTNIKDIYDAIQPKYGIEYLANGNESGRKYYYE